MLIYTAIAMVGLIGPTDGPTEGSGHPAHVHIDEGQGQVVVTVGPLDVAGGMHYHHDGPAEHAAFTWPEDGWMQGYRIDVVGADGELLPREMIHHAGVANLSRRQLAYPAALRLFGVGQETDPVTMPSWMGLHLAAGDELMAYFALVNESGAPIEGASLRITLDWRPADAKVRSRPQGFTGRRGHPSSRFRSWEAEVKDVLPLVLTASPNGYDDPEFDVGPGISTVSAEVVLPLGGYLRAAGGHMHDFASEIRLEDVETGDVIVRLEAVREADGTIERVGQTVFPFSLRGARLDAGRRYRIVGVYDNPTDELLPDAGMAYIAGAFIPDDVQAWPAVDADDPRYQADLAVMVDGGADPEESAHAEVASEGEGHAH